MKTHLCIVVMVAFTNLVSAQDGHSILSTKSIWTSIDCFKIGTTEFKTVRKETMFGDTTIDGLAYKKVYRDTSVAFNWATAQYVCAVREANKLVYYVPNDGSGEKLLYDFSKSQGDSVEVVGLHLNYPTPIKLRIDSVFTQTINGVARRTYKFTANGAYHTEEYWYDGIGSSFGFLTPFLSVSDNIFTLKCNAKNDTLYFLKDNIGNFLCSAGEPANNCEYNAMPTGIDVPSGGGLDIYPNPTSDKLYVKTEMSNAIYILYGLDGRSVVNGTLPVSGIDIKHVPTGLYFLLVESNGKLHRAKVVIE